MIAIKPLLSTAFIGNLVFLLQISATVLRMMFNTRINRIIARGYALAPLLLLLKLWRKYLIYDCHGYAYKEQIIQGRRTRAMTTRPFDWLALKLADCVISIREELREDFSADVQGKTIILPNGVDLEAFAVSQNENILAKYHLPLNKKLVGFIGNWEPWIALEDMLDSARYFTDEVQLVVIGAGKGLEDYKEAYPSILFTGVVPHQDAVALLKKMDVCLQPCYNETILKNRSSRKILEYLAAGKPIIISDVEHKEKFLKEGENTLVYKVGDPQDLAEKVKTILSDAKLYAKMSRNNLELAKEFSWGEVIEHSGLIRTLQA